MASDDPSRWLAAIPLLAALGLGGCATTSGGGMSYRHLSSRDCMARVMYFESNRSSPDGMIAVGTVVMNRVESGKYPQSVCGVVGQNNQFADGALYKKMSGKSKDLAYAMADRVLDGERHPAVGDAMFFHTYGYHYPYKNMHYVVVAGGNAFYEKRTPGTFKPGIPKPTTPIYQVAAAERVPVAAAPMKVAAAPQKIVTASANIGAQDRVRLAMFLTTGEGL